MPTFNYDELLRSLVTHQAQNKGPVQAWQGEGEGSYLATLNPEDPGYAQAAGAWEWNNGLTGNEGVTYSYDPATNSFIVAQGDATSGIQRYRVSESGQEDMGFEHIDRNSKYNSNLGKMAAIAGTTLAAGALWQAYAGSAGFSPGATEAITSEFAFSSPAQAQAAASWSQAGAAEVAAGAGASALEAGAAPAVASATGAGAPLTMEGILNSNYAVNPGAVGATELGQAAMYGAPATAAGASAVMQGNPASGPIDAGLGGELAGTVGAVGAPPGAAPTTPPSTGSTPPKPTAPNSPGNQGTVLEQLLSGGLGVDGLLRLIAGGIGAAQQRSFGQALLDRAAAATPNREFYEGQLKSVYDNPSSYLMGPEYQAIQDVVHNKLQRSDAAGGRLASDFGRQVQLQTHAYGSLDNYRRTLSNIVGQNQQTYSGQNNMFQQGAQADNSWMNGVLNALSSRPQGTATQPGTQAPQANPASLSWINQIPSWFSGNAGAPVINLDAIA